MLTRKTQYGWMALGGLICLFGLVLACKLRDGSKAAAQAEPPPPPQFLETDKDKPSPSAPEECKTKSAPAKDDRPMMEPIMPASFSPNMPSDPKTPPPEKPKAPSIVGPPLTLSEPLPAPPPAPLSIAEKPEQIDAVKSVSPTTTKSPPVKKNEQAPHLYGTTPATSAVKPPPPPPPSALSVTPATANPTNFTEQYYHRMYDVQLDPAHEIKPQPGEPPLAPAPGPVQVYRVNNSETLQDIARRTLGSTDRSNDLHRLNPTLKPDDALSPGTVVRLPADACLQNDAEPVQPLPLPRSKPTPPKAKALPLTGTYQCSLDDKGRLTLPRAIRDQLAGCTTVLVSPGPDECLWLTTSPHLERLGERLEQSHANEADVRVFKRLYFAQTEKLSVNSDGRIGVPERLTQFAGLHQEVVLIGIDDHFEVWDAARWRQYTQQKSGAGRSTAVAEQE